MIVYSFYSVYCLKLTISLVNAKPNARFQLYTLLCIIWFQNLSILLFSTTRFDLSYAHLAERALHTLVTYLVMILFLRPVRYVLRNYEEVNFDQESAMAETVTRKAVVRKRQPSRDREIEMTSI